MDIEEMRDRLIEIVREKSFRNDREFTLASGKKSRMYFNMKPTMMDPEGAELVAELMVEELKSVEADYVGGLELGAVPLTAQVVMASQRSGLPIPGFLVRKSVKGHGTEKQIEGLPEGETLKGRRAVILEDVSTSGGSALKAAEIVRAAGGKPVAVMTILDREEGADEAFADAGLGAWSILKKSDFVE